MSKSKFTDRQLRLWIIAAISAPLAQTVGGTSWIAVLAVGILCGIFLYLMQFMREKLDTYSRWFAVPVFIWVLIKLLYLLDGAGNCWQADRSGYFVPVILLILAAMSAQKGPKAAAGVAVIVFCFLVMGYGTTIASSIKSVRIAWLGGGENTIQPQMAAVFLLPIVTFLLPAEKRTLRLTFVVLTAILGVVLALAVNGVMSADSASKYENSFFEMSRSISIADMVERIESITAAIMVMGWFTLFSIHFSALSSVWAEGGKGSTLTIWIAAGAAALLHLLGVRVEAWHILMADFTLSALILVQTGISCRKNIKKSLTKGE